MALAQFQGRVIAMMAGEGQIVIKVLIELFWHVEWKLATYGIQQVCTIILSTQCAWNNVFSQEMLSDL